MIVGLCRFSFLGRGKARGWRSVPRNPDAARRLVFDEARLAFRFRLFERFTLPGLRAQTDGDFRLIVLTSAELPKPHLDRLAGLVAGDPRFRLVAARPQPAGPRIRRLFAEAFGEARQRVSFRIDDDDGLSVRYVERLRAAVGRGAPEAPLFVSFGRGLTVGFEGDEVAWASECAQPFGSAGLAFAVPDGRRRCVYDFVHANAPRAFDTLALAGPPAWLRALHGFNVSAAPPQGTRGFERTSLDALAAAFAEDFPYLARLSLASPAAAALPRAAAPAPLAPLAAAGRRLGRHVGRRLRAGLAPKAAGPRDPAGPLGAREQRDALVMPCAPEGQQLRMGVLDAAGACIPDSLLWRSFAKGTPRAVGLPADPAPAAATHAGPAIYLGPLLDGFGHFLLESLARAWYAKRHPELPVVWSCRPAETPGAAARLRGWQAAIVALLGLRNPVLLADRPLGFDRLVLPDVGYRIQTFFSPEHADFLAAVPHAPEPGRKLWLSRTRLGNLENASMPEVERRLAGLGWTVVHPETLPIPEQMAELARAERVAGEQGSALHSLVLLRDPRDLRVDLFLRDPARDRFNLNYETIARAKGLRQRAHRIESEVVLGRQGRFVEKRASRPAEYFEKLGEPVPAEAAAPV